ncbi:integral membrane sensor signal transduction histidine kinase [Methylobacterium sp. 4-46]|uniref:ATP-binding protein n=1 Tax=unclassified Methylobacterium TaxID=2615210 RepID=UPI000152D556|nr:MULTISPECIES: ATP-binding protein [Methylobacterium]ACA19891.1 integral membrane sensor signal transduction histidine kinase [Methylobacterium sp. 4-46]WFT79075.1 ATP-binding protein [Methylobacterium nodulans]
MRSAGVSRRVFTVGAIPVVIAVLIALAAWALLIEAERARDGAVLSSETFHTFTFLHKTRDDYVGRTSVPRAAARSHFDRLAAEASAQLAKLRQIGRTADQLARVETARRDLTAQIEQMRSLVQLEGDLEVASTQMARRADTLVVLTDAERQRQQAQNARMVSVLTRTDAALELSQRVVSALRDLREAISAVELNKTRVGQPVFQIEFDELEADIRLLNLTGAQLHTALLAAERGAEADELTTLLRSYRERSQSDGGLSRVIAEGFELTRATQSGSALIAWCDRLIRENADKQRRLQAEVAALIRSSVSSNEAELTAQSIALAALRLAQQSASALARRSIEEVSNVVVEGTYLAGRAHSLAMPLGIQGDMMAAIQGWRESLAATVEKVREQNALIAEMDRRDTVIAANAQALSRAFIDDANRFGSSIRRLLLAGAAGALLLGTIAVVSVARSITRPLRLLTSSVLRATSDPSIEHIDLAARPDELGDIARASNTFLAELRRREDGWRDAARRADEALTTLRQTQDDLVRSEKLASLGQLVAGVSHEISTPLGIALTTSTQVQVDSASFEALVNENRLSRSRLTQYASRMREGAQLVTTNLMRASDLLYSFKQVASDQVLEERRVIDLGAWTEDLLKSLRALARPGRHELAVDCPGDLSLDTYPGILAQVLTNAVKNAIDHGSREDHILRATIKARAEGMQVAIEIIDNGAGIEPQYLDRVFDPFFTTARASGGTGLGLHIIHNLVVHRLHGSVEIQSAVGQGTRLKLKIPCHLG